ncbi:hypothetical protein [Fibrella forsythiae]|uniref:Uncharacterized protein n=1 Tax=Fibrella forsythiae TaxID=2817061 RepID=A0ABS3JP01_9BACT|nr:hypothetical protein [Fibrella forsythiae]MBO0951717.1 hypothetical protein [Fibrella forsythiae]
MPDRHSHLKLPNSTLQIRPKIVGGVDTYLTGQAKHEPAEANSATYLTMITIRKVGIVAVPAGVGGRTFQKLG